MAKAFRVEDEFLGTEGAEKVYARTYIGWSNTVLNPHNRAFEELLWQELKQGRTISSARTQAESKAKRLTVFNEGYGLLNLSMPITKMYGQSAWKISVFSPENKEKNSAK